MRISVIICSHNPRPDYLRRTLAGLRAQTLPVQSWECLLIDNASKNPIADAWDLSWHPLARHVREEEVGLTAARQRGIREAKADLLVFVDDDNVLDPDFLERALAIQASHPHLGVFGAGILEPEFEVQPPRELMSRVALLALRKERSALWTNRLSDAGCVPWGAGLCVSRRVADVYLRLVEKMRATLVLDRRGQQLFSGGDDVFSWASVWADRGFGVFPALRITHLISAGRLTRPYFVRLIHDHAYSHRVLDFLLEGIRPRPVGPARYVQVLLHGIRNGLFSMQCQWASSRGGAAAIQFIAASGMQPIGDELRGIPQPTAKTSPSATPLMAQPAGTNWAT